MVSRSLTVTILRPGHQVRILLIAYHFPPDPAVGALRPGRLVANLDEAGHEVDVVTVCGPEEPPGFRRSSERVRVLAVKPWPHPRHWYLGLKAGMQRLVARMPWVGRRADSSNPGASQGWVREPDPSWLKRQLLTVVGFPDERQEFIPAALVATRRLARQTRYDVVYTTAPPASLHLIGLLAARRLAIPWVMEYRDPWVGNALEAVAAGWARRLEARLERSCLERAELVVTTTQALANHLATRSPNPARILCALNGIPTTALRPQAKHPAGPFRIVHSGTIYGRRDPTRFIEALGILKQDQGLGATALQVDLVGTPRWYRGRSLDDIARTEGVEDMVQIHPRLPVDECNRLIAEADLLLLLAQYQPMQVPNKLFDYLAARRPILALAETDGETAVMLRLAGRHHVLDPAASAHEIAAGVREAMDAAGRFRKSINERIFDEWSVAAQQARLVGAVVQLGHRPPRT